MTNTQDLNVDTDGLRTAATSSESSADELDGSPLETPIVTHPSGYGVAAVDAALVRVRGRHGRRVIGQVGALRTSGARYDTVDVDGADAVGTVLV